MATQTTSTAQTMTQVNVRIDAQLKRQAEDVLRLMGATPTNVIRALYSKIAMGANEFEKTQRFLGLKNSQEEDDSAARQALVDGWNLGNAFFELVGTDSSSVPIDRRPWKQVYEEALVAHYENKGLL